MSQSELTFIANAAEYAVLCHEKTNHLYGEEPYSVHLNECYDIAVKYINLIPEYWQPFVLAAVWCHDVIEDCRQTYNDVKKQTLTHVADLVYAVTNDKGKTRKERANEKYYQGIRETPYATFIKLVDRIANMQHSLKNNKRLFEMYREEYSEFRKQLYDERYDTMFADLIYLTAFPKTNN